MIHRSPNAAKNVVSVPCQRKQIQHLFHQLKRRKKQSEQQDLYFQRRANFKDFKKDSRNRIICFK
jgi:hypothetical protein